MLAWTPVTHITSSVLKTYSQSATMKGHMNAMKSMVIATTTATVMLTVYLIANTISKIVYMMLIITATNHFVLITTRIVPNMLQMSMRLENASMISYTVF